MGVEANLETFHECLQILGDALSDLAEIGREASSSLDVEELDSDGLRSALRDMVEDVGQEVIVAWPADRAAVRVGYHLVIERIDDLWYPSTDDLVIIDDSKGVGRVIILDHEERLCIAPLGS
ncbi:hypothetical protein [Streptomyces diastatochromogenes]|uniref:hypothetical protein n=1 Tax=Streptomyces diastatochromogenes TaxID=42236 RepID=UPI00369B77E3